ncbi:MAG TPA: regulatory protein RecX [Gemmatimonadales bacterium]|nr:regulatory protein RecX [Gemmatimonadales bacterium]
MTERLVEAAERAAVQALARRGYARRDLERWLLKRQHTPTVVQAAVERLAGRGLVDDARFAERYAAQRAARGRGPARLIRELIAQGVEGRVAERAVRRALEDEGIELRAAARAVAEQRVRVLGALPPTVRRRRLRAFLLRRGFDASEVRQVVVEVCG